MHFGGGSEPGQASAAGAAGGDEAADAEHDEDEQQDGHGGLLFDGAGVRKLAAIRHFDEVDDAPLTVPRGSRAGRW
jgi:hypothetical protein